MSFRVIEAESAETPLIVEIPHAGLRIDAETAAWTVAPVRSIGRDADLLVDQLYQDAPTHGATVLVAEMSRYVVDLNRSPEDLDARTAASGKAPHLPHGLIWRLTTEGHPATRAVLPQSEVQRRLDTFYFPYHQRLQQLIDAKREKFGYCVILAAHSMPSRGRAGHTDPGGDRAQIVPGTRGKTTCAHSLLQVPELLAKEFEYSLVHDAPYRGGFTTYHYGRPNQNVHAIQIELSRSIYMDEDHLRPNGGFEKTRLFCSRLVEQLALASKTDPGA